MTLHGSRLPFVRLIAFSGVLAVVLASCQSSYDNDRMAAGAPSGRRDPPSQPAGVERGKQLFQQVGCMGCHAVNGQGGTVGPDLSNEGNAGHPVQWLRTQIRDPKSHDPQTAMPAFDNLSSQQVNDLVDYMERLKTGRTQAGPGGAAPSSATSARLTGSGGDKVSVVTKGGELWSRTCGQCHNLRSPGEYSDAQWAVAVDHMRVRVPLTGREQRDILAFLQASN
jgi:mono/diheme cytochrome c family protein